MNNSPTTVHDGERNRASSIPRATIHKQILDAATAQPDASTDELSTQVSGASVSLVEKVLEEYGDPATIDQPASKPIDDAVEPQTNESINGTGETPMTSHDDHQEHDLTLDPAQYTTKQLETLREVRRHPDATQAELAERLDISDATVCQRVQSIDGFDWSERREFVDAVFDNGEVPHDVSESGTHSNVELVELIDKLNRQLHAVEHRLDTQMASKVALANPDLTHKILHVCLKSDNISEDEELEIVKAFIATQPDSE